MEGKEQECCMDGRDNEGEDNAFIAFERRTKCVLVTHAVGREVARRADHRRFMEVSGKWSMQDKKSCGGPAALCGESESK